MKDQTIVIVSLALILLSGIFIIRGLAPNPAVAPAPPEAAYAPNTWKTWTDGAYLSKSAAASYSGYALQYPRDFDVYRGDQANGNLIGAPRVKLAFPQDAFQNPKTNYGEAYLTVSVANDKNTEAQCYANPNYDTAGAEMSAITAINGADFHMATTTDVGAGQIYTSKVYRTLRNNRCYEITLTVHTGNIHNYPEGTVTEFDKERAFSVLEQILGTFTFTEIPPQ